MRNLFRLCMFLISLLAALLTEIVYLIVSAVNSISRIVFHVFEGIVILTALFSWGFGLETKEEVAKMLDSYSEEYAYITV